MIAIIFIELGLRFYNSSFVDMDEDDDFNEFTSQDLIHIHKVNRRGRKCETKVTGIP